MFGCELADVHRPFGARHLLALVCDMTPSFASGRFCRVASRGGFRFGSVRRRLRDWVAHANEWMPHRFMGRTE
jgi:hypothetical protein